MSGNVLVKIGGAARIEPGIEVLQIAQRLHEIGAAASHNVLVPVAIAPPR